MTDHKNSMRRGTVSGISAAAVFAAAFLLANIPGDPVVGPNILSDGKYGPHFECGVESIVHGWPFSYLRHDGGHWPRRNGPSAWSVGGNAQFAVAPFTADLALLAVGTFAIGWIVRGRIRKHAWHFGIIHLMLTLLCGSAVLAFFTSRHRPPQIAFLRRSQQNIAFADWQPFGPQWLRNITGPHYWEWGDRLVTVGLQHSNEISDLPGKSAIKVLQIYTVKCDAMPPLDNYDDLIAIDMCMVNYDYSNIDGDDDPEFWPCLRVIAKRHSLQGLNLYETGVSDRGLRELVGMPHLANLELSGNPDVTDNGLVHLASIQSLKKLGLWGTGVTQAGVEKLQGALPDCAIGWD